MGMAAPHQDQMLPHFSSALSLPDLSVESTGFFHATTEWMIQVIRFVGFEYAPPDRVK